MRKGEASNGRRFATPVLLIVGLLVIHWVVSDWPAIPRLISSTLASIN
jgi:hypothetical protein